MKTDSAASGVFVSTQPSPPRPGEDRTPIPCDRYGENRYGRSDPSRAWREFPCIAHVRLDRSVPVLTPEEVLAVHALRTLAVVSGRSGNWLAGQTGSAELRWILARHAESRYECANELQELLYETCADAAYPSAIFGPHANVAARSGTTLDIIALAKSLDELRAHERNLTRKYEELLVSASPELHAVLARHWRESQEIEGTLNSALRVPNQGKTSPI